MIKLDFLDHIAIRVSDLEVSANWYESVLGMKRVMPEKWAPYPIFMLAGNSGVALFPVRKNEDGSTLEKDLQKGDHFAFRVDNVNFEAAKEHFNSLGIDFHFQDHYYFHSIYFLDPDGYQLEFTTQIREME